MILKHLLLTPLGPGISAGSGVVRQDDHLAMRILTRELASVCSPVECSVCAEVTSSSLCLAIKMGPQHSHSVAVSCDRETPGTQVLTSQFVTSCS